MGNSLLNRIFKRKNQNNQGEETSNEQDDELLLRYYASVPADDKEVIDQYVAKMRENSGDAIGNIYNGARLMYDELGKRATIEIDFIRNFMAFILKDIESMLKKNSKQHNGPVAMLLLIRIKELDRCISGFKELYKETILKKHALGQYNIRYAEDSNPASLKWSYGSLLQKIEICRDGAKALIQENMALRNQAKDYVRKTKFCYFAMADDGHKYAKYILHRTFSTNGIVNSDLKKVEDIDVYHEDAEERIATLIADAEFRIKRFGYYRKDNYDQLLKNMNNLAKFYFKRPSEEWDIDDLRHKIGEFTTLTEACLYECSLYLTDEQKDDLLKALYKLRYNYFLISGDVDDFDTPFNANKHRDMRLRIYSEMTNEMISKIKETYGIEEKYNLQCTHTNNLLRLHDLYCGKIPTNDHEIWESIFKEKLYSLTRDNEEKTSYRFPFHHSIMHFSIEEIYSISKLFRMGNAAFDDLDKSLKSSISSKKGHLLREVVRLNKPKCPFGINTSAVGCVKKEISEAQIDRLLINASWRRLCEEDSYNDYNILDIPSAINFQEIERMTSVNLIRMNFSMGPIKAIRVDTIEQLRYVCDSIRQIENTDTVFILVSEFDYEYYSDEIGKLNNSENFVIKTIPNRLSYIKLNEYMKDGDVLKKV